MNLERTLIDLLDAIDLGQVDEAESLAGDLAREVDEGDTPPATLRDCRIAARGGDTRAPARKCSVCGKAGHDRRYHDK